MSMNQWKIARRSLVLAALLCGLTGVARAQAQYNVAVSLDYTGPFANVMDSWWGGQQSVFDWWNETRGRQLGIRLHVKTYDMRYDASVVARTWPQVLSQDKPIAFLGMGTPDLVSLMKRLPADKVPMIMGTAMVAPLWTADGWHFSYRPTYSHEFAGLFASLQSQTAEKRPLRIGTVSTQGIAGYVDQVNGVVALAKAYPDRFQVVSSQWVDNQPISVTNQIREMAKEKPDLVLVGTNTAQVVATLKALKELDLKIPVVTSSHNGLNEVAKAVPIADLEGSYSVFAFAPYNDPSVKAVEIFNKYNKTKGTWGITSAQTAGQALLTVAAIERAAAKVGADKLTGQAVYDALLAGPFDASQFQGLLPAISLKRDAPFPTDNLAVKAMTVKGGQVVAVGRDWMPVPALGKW
ncbi:ABC transporter substrate-binding protein [Hydrogenophaga sp.]|uniref:ABC transporter substrate-binding protein n=1 Tax=Hydrogenophaga sp. TaxID=1904254 RepID=UPI003F70836A